MVDFDINEIMNEIDRLLIKRKINENVKEFNIDTILIHHGTNKLLREAFVKPRNSLLMPKPHGGLWCSRHLGKNSEYLSVWSEYVISSGMSKNIDDYVLLKLKNDSKILYINTFEEALEIQKKYKLTKESIFAENIYEEKEIQRILELSQDTHMFNADFIEIAKDYDCIYFSNSDYRLQNFMYGWDIESIVILNFDCIEIIDKK